ncbi:anthranilate synthase component I [Gracilaria domingensis]|nr:anthranilate synthase component I [Gracilaria domingensis]
MKPPHSAFVFSHPFLSGTSTRTLITAHPATSFQSPCTPRATLSNPPPRVSGGGRAPAAESFSRYDGKCRTAFTQLASDPNVRLVPIWRKLFADLLTPVVVYNCLVSETEQTTPSFLLESVHTGERIGRYSLIGARPVREITAFEKQITVYSHENGEPEQSTFTADDPWELMRQMTEEMKPVDVKHLPGGHGLFSGGWVGFGGYDTMRYAELKSLPFSAAPKDDRGLPDLHFGLYRDVIVFDHVAKVVYVIHWADLNELPDRSEENITELFDKGVSHVDQLADRVFSANSQSSLQRGRVTLNTDAAAKHTCASNMTKEQFMAALEKIKYYISIGDTFQTVFSQRFERWSKADPFSVYRALRIINPSPYMIYVQARGCHLVASSPEILTHVEGGILTNRPLAGTRRRGTTKEEDEVLMKELLADEKDRSEHMMLVDLGRNDVGRVSEYGTVVPERLMQVEKYSHVMHISSTVKGTLREGLTSWDALRSTLPAGTISGAPKIRSMQIIDELEPTKRGPYGGGIGYISFHDTMNIALALRTMVVPDETRVNEDGKKEWRYYLQAGAGIVYESDPEAEYTETMNKAMALSRAIDLAENALLPDQ